MLFRFELNFAGTGFAITSFEDISKRKEGYMRVPAAKAILTFALIFQIVNPQPVFAAGVARVITDT